MIVSRRSPAARCRGTVASAAGSGVPAGDDRGQQSLSPPCRGSCTSGSQSQSSFPPIPAQPWLRYTPLRVSLWKYQRRQRTRRVIRHNTNSRTVIQIYNKEHLRYSVCIHTHTHTHMWCFHCRISMSHWQAKFSGRARQRKGTLLCPLQQHMGTNSKSERLSIHAISSYWGAVMPNLYRLPNLYRSTSSVFDQFQTCLATGDRVE